MRRTFEIETSMFSTSPTKRWKGGSEIYVEDVTLEYPDEIDHLSNDELMELADGEENGVFYVISA